MVSVKGVKSVLLYTWGWGYVTVVGSLTLGEETYNAVLPSSRGEIVACATHVVASRASALVSRRERWSMYSCLGT